jgi:hypothetical protein
MYRVCLFNNKWTAYQAVLHTFFVVFVFFVSPWFALLVIQGIQPPCRPIHRQKPQFHRVFPKISSFEGILTLFK